MTRFVLLTVILAFGALSAVAVAEHGYLGLFAHLLANSAGWQVGVDLVIACTLAVVWMIADARKSGRSAWPFVLLTLGLGSFGPLLYLLVGSFRDAQTTGAAYGAVRSHG